MYKHITGVYVHVKSISKDSITAFSLPSQKEFVPLHTKAEEKIQTSAQLKMLNQINI